MRSAQEKARSEAIIAAIGEGLVIVDRNFRILYQNQILRSLGSDPQEDHCYLVYAGRDTICDNCPVSRTFQDGEIHTTEKSVNAELERLAAAHPGTKYVRMKIDGALTVGAKIWE